MPLDFTLTEKYTNIYIREQPARENKMEKYQLTVVFSDGEVVVEKFNTQLGMERAIRAWKEAEAEDAKNGETYTIVSMEPSELEPTAA